MAKNKTQLLAAAMALGGNVEALDQLTKAEIAEWIETAELAAAGEGAVLGDITIKATGTVDTDPDALTEEPITQPGYTVAEGKSITTKTGIKQNGDEIFADMLSGGEDAFEVLVKKKFLVCS